MIIWIIGFSILFWVGSHVHSTHKIHTCSKSLLPTDYWESNPLEPFSPSWLEVQRTWEGRCCLYQQAAENEDWWFIRMCVWDEHVAMGLKNLRADCWVNHIIVTIGFSLRWFTLKSCDIPNCFECTSGVCLSHVVEAFVGAGRGSDTRRSHGWCYWWPELQTWTDQQLWRQTWWYEGMSIPCAQGWLVISTTGC